MFTYLCIDFLHQFSIFINYGLQIFILFSIFIFTKKKVLSYILLFNVIWLCVFISYMLLDDCIFLLLSEKIVPISKYFRFIDPSERLTMMFHQKIYNKSKLKKKLHKSTFNKVLFIQLILLVVVNLIVLFALKN